MNEPERLLEHVVKPWERGGEMQKIEKIEQDGTDYDRNYGFNECCDLWQADRDEIIKQLVIIMRTKAYELRIEPFETPQICKNIDQLNKDLGGE